MSFGAFALNYTNNISIHPLCWTWMFKVGPLPTFLPKKNLKIFRKFQCNEVRYNLTEKLAQVKTILPWWANTISPIFFKFCVTFRFSWKCIETTKKPFLPIYKVTLVWFEASVMIRKLKNRHFFTFTRYLWAQWSTNPTLLALVWSGGMKCLICKVIYSTTPDVYPSIMPYVAVNSQNSWLLVRLHLITPTISQYIH